MLDGIKACIFDMDGTIIDSMGLWHDIDVAYFKKYNKKLPESYQSEIEGMSMYETAVYTKSKYGFEDSVEDIMREWNLMAEDYYASKIDYKPHVIEYFRFLKDKGIKLGMATSNSRYLFDTLSASIHIADYMDVVITGEDVVKGKPDPECYITAARELSVDPEDCLVFEDITVGLQAAISAGMKTCAVADSYSEAQWEEKVKMADYSLLDYSDVC